MPGSAEGKKDKVKATGRPARDGRADRFRRAGRGGDPCRRHTGLVPGRPHEAQQAQPAADPRGDLLPDRQLARVGGRAAAADEPDARVGRARRGGRHDPLRLLRRRAAFGPHPRPGHQIDALRRACESDHRRGHRLGHRPRLDAGRNGLRLVGLTAPPGNPALPELPGGGSWRDAGDPPYLRRRHMAGATYAVEFAARYR